MRKNIDELGRILGELKCRFAESVYNSYVKEQYSLKGCKEESDKEELRDYIFLLEEKIKLLRYNFKGNNQLPFRLNKTSIEYFFEKENSLTNCDRKLLEKII